LFKKRLKNSLNFCCPLLFSVLISIRILQGNSDAFAFSNKTTFSGDNDRIVFLFLPFKDTFYYLGNQYIEINLGKQIAMLFSRDGTVDTVKISSGNKFLSKGIETPTGLYAVQNKAPIQISRQFENAEMLNWIGFNGNIGFHGLKKTGYYASLGRRPSSHGCVRMANEDGARWYQIVNIGIPVLVYRKEPIVIIKFASYSEVDYNKDLVIQKGNPSINRILNARIKDISKGKYYRKHLYKVILEEKLALSNPNLAVEKDSIKIPFQLPPLVLSANPKAERISTHNALDLMNMKDTCCVKF